MRHPQKASRPFDRGRDGFVMGEGAGALILESMAHAKKRKARIYAEVAGYAATSEAYHMVIPREDGAEVATTMRLALEDAGLRPGSSITSTRTRPRRQWAMPWRSRPFVRSSNNGRTGSPSVRQNPWSAIRSEQPVRWRGLWQPDPADRTDPSNYEL